MLITKILNDYVSGLKLNSKRSIAIAPTLIKNINSVGLLETSKQVSRGWLEGCGLPGPEFETTGLYKCLLSFIHRRQELRDLRLLQKEQHRAQAVLNLKLKDQREQIQRRFDQEMNVSVIDLHHPQHLSLSRKWLMQLYAKHTACLLLCCQFNLI